MEKDSITFSLSDCFFCAQEAFVRKRVAAGYIPVCELCFARLEPLLQPIAR